MKVLMKSGDIVAEKYRLNERLGIGGMGQVWSAIHLQTDREFAIKVMHPHIAESQEARSRFTREAKASARINHPNVIDIFDVGELPNGSLYLVMELLDGLPLADAFFASPPLSVRDFLSIMLDTSHALEAAHQVGVVHRDVKPANIYLHRERVSGLACAKMVDFGISKFSAANDSVATSTGSVLGSPRYMSPEQTRSAASTDARSDIWALGVVLFEGLVGFWPHDGDSYSSLVVAIVTVPPKSIEEHAPHLPKELRSLIHNCLQPLETRIQSAAEVARQLTAIIADGDLASLSLPEPKTKAGGVTTTGQVSVKTPPPSKGLGARGRVDDEKTEMHQQLPISHVDDEASDDGPTGRVDADDPRASAPDIDQARADFNQMLEANVPAPAGAWKPSRPSPHEAPRPAAGTPAPTPPRDPQESAPGLPDAAQVEDVAGQSNLDTIALSSPPAVATPAAVPAPLAAPAATPQPAAPTAKPGDRNTVKLTSGAAPAPLTETESKMNMAASQAPPPAPHTAHRKSAARKQRGNLGLAAAVMSAVGIGVGWLVVSIAGGADTTGDAATTATEETASEEPSAAPPPAPMSGEATASDTGTEVEDVPDAPEASAEPMGSADATPSISTSDAQAPKPPATKRGPRGPRMPPPPKAGIDDLGSGL